MTTILLIEDAVDLANAIRLAPDPHAQELEYTEKVKLEIKRAATSGGCG